MEKSTRALAILLFGVIALSFVASWIFEALGIQ